jgi:hypothetical protein
MRSVNMRSFKSSVYGYARRQARREVYRACDGYMRYRNTNDNNKKVETNPNDVWIGLGVIIGFIIFLNIACQI